MLLAAVRDSHQLHLYVDGNLVASSAEFDSAEANSDAYDISNHQPLQIGAGAGDYFHGKMRDVRLYRRALHAREIEQLAHAGA